MSSTKISTLFTPFKVGDMQLQHRIVLAPLTRLRADEKHIHTDLAVEYYEQRGSTPGTLLVTEATPIAPKAGAFPKMPGIYNNEQIAGWKKVTDAVHGKGSFIFLQLGALGRSALPPLMQIAPGGPYDVVGPSAIPIDSTRATPRPLTVEEIKEYLQLFAQAAKNAVQAGFDGVEVHAANGFLLDQFLQSNSNQRTDEYGGSIENRIRFVVEVVDAVASAIGVERTSIRISPWSPFQGMRMPDPIPTFSALIKHLVEHHPRLAYIHVIEPRISAGEDAEPVASNESNDFVRDIWSPRPLILAGGFNRETALSEAEKGEKNVLVAVGRYFTSNPDLPKRWIAEAELTPYDRPTFYTPGPKGYTDWALSEGIKQ